MGLFSAFKPDAAAQFSAGKNSGPDKMMLLGAMLRDLGSGNGPETLMGTQQFLAGRQAQQQKLAAQQRVGGMFGGGAPQQSTAPIMPVGDFAGAAPTPAPQPMGLREMAPMLAEAAAAGVDISPYVTMADKISRRVEVANGVAYDPMSTAPGARVGVNLQNFNGFMEDPNDPANRGKYRPRLMDNATPLYDQNGQVVAQRLLDGTIQAMGDQARATEGAKAEFDLVDVPMPDGSTQKMPRSQAVTALGGQGGATPGLGRSQSPAAQTLAVEGARTEATRGAALPKAFAGLEDQARVTDFALETIDRILGVTIGPDGKPVQAGNSMISGLSSGFGANLAGVKGSPAYALEEAIRPLRAQIAFGELQKMRDNSPTGGALGQVAIEENRMLASMLGSLDPGQPPEQLAQNLLRARTELARIRDARVKAFEQTYSGQGAPRASAQTPPSRAAVEAEARRRGLIR